MGVLLVRDGVPGIDQAGSFGSSPIQLLLGAGLYKAHKAAHLKTYCSVVTCPVCLEP